MRLGIIGGGQLGQMLAASADAVGVEARIADPTPSGLAVETAPCLARPYDAPETIEFLRECDVVTYEFEHVPPDLVAALADRTPLLPHPRALEVTSDRLAEKNALRRAGLATADFVEVDSREDLEGATRSLGFPLVLKTRRQGYDGRGQWRIHSPDDIAEAIEELDGQAAIAEAWVPFDREASLLAVRSKGGEIHFWPVTENVHVGGMLVVSRAPARDPGPGVEHARKRVSELLEQLDYVGVLAMEFFVVGDQWIANEMACRVHNSGHWTIEGAETSQFENHVRAVAGLPLGSTESRGATGMINLIGGSQALEGPPTVEAGALHWYGKSWRFRRKLGHLTLSAGSPTDLEAELERAGEQLLRSTGDQALFGLAEGLR